MDYKTKDYYRQTIKEIAKRSKISEIYIAKKLLELAETGKGKAHHIGYYLFGKNKNIVYEKIGSKTQKIMSKRQKVNYYISLIVIFSLLISLAITLNLINKVHIICLIIAFLALIIPVSEFVIQLFQYILSKFVKPKIIPKIDLYNGIDEDNKTMVVIPTILKNKEKVKELMQKLEVFYLANKSKNLYFCLLGDCSESSKKDEPFDKEIIEEGFIEVERLNKKYSKDNITNSESLIDSSNLTDSSQPKKENDTLPNMQIFNFAYRKRKWNEKQGTYLGWERKRGALTEFVELLLGNMSSKQIEEYYHVNTLSHIFQQKRTDTNKKEPTPIEIFNNSR